MASGSPPDHSTYPVHSPSHLRESIVPFPQSPSEDEREGDLGARTSLDSTAAGPPYEVHTTIEHANRFNTIVRTVIAVARPRRRSAPESTDGSHLAVQLHPDPGSGGGIPLAERERERGRRESRDSRASGAYAFGSGAGAGTSSARGRSSATLSPPLPNINTVMFNADGSTKRVSFEGERPTAASLLLGNGMHHTTSEPTPLRLPPPLTPTRSGGGSPFRDIFRRRRRADRFVLPTDPYRVSLSHALSTVTHTRSLLLAWTDFSLRIIYINLLLRLPSIYFSRVGRLFEEAELTKPEMERFVKSLHEPEWEVDVETGSGGHSQLEDFRKMWEDFVDHVIKEWKTLNVVSALLLTAVFQVAASPEPLTRTTALLSLVCAFLSLLFGCIYIVRFQTMRTMRKAARWAQAAQASTTSIFWNVWVFLSLPSIFLAWSLLAFSASILSYTWITNPTSTTTPQNYPSAATALLSRLIITLVFFLGLVYFALVVWTFRSYSEPTPYPSAYSSPRMGGAAGLDNNRPGSLSMEGLGRTRTDSEPIKPSLEQVRGRTMSQSS